MSNHALLLQESRVFLPIIADKFEVPEARRLTVAASILEGLDMVEKKTDELGGLIYRGPDIYEEFIQSQCNIYDTEYHLKKFSLSLTQVEVKEEHRYPIAPPRFKLSLKGLKDIPVVPKELEEDPEQKQERKGFSYFVRGKHSPCGDEEWPC